jgi:hypothetical protein
MYGSIEYFVFKQSILDEPDNKTPCKPTAFRHMQSKSRSSVLFHSKCLLDNHLYSNWLRPDTLDVVVWERARTILDEMKIFFFFFLLQFKLWIVNKYRQKNFYKNINFEIVVSWFFFIFWITFLWKNYLI